MNERSIAGLKSAENPDKREKSELSDDEIVSRLGRAINTVNPKRTDIFNNTNEEALDFWNRATSTIADFHNPSLKAVLSSESTKTVIAVCKFTKSNLPSFPLSNDRRLENIEPEAMEQLIVDFGVLSGDDLLNTKINENRLWRSLPGIAGVQNKKISPLIAGQYERIVKSSDPNSILEY